ncbi:MAG: Ig-like domain-containing protein [Armatimonadota bacterium]
MPAAAQDTEPPTTPPAFNAVAYARSVRLTWQASSDNVGVTGYEVYRNGSLVTTVTGLEFYESPAPGGSLQYFVRAVDAAGNRSAPTETKTVNSQSWLWARPPNWTNAHSGKRYHIFYVGDTVRFELETAPGACFPFKPNQSVRFEVRDYWGNLLDEGPIQPSGAGLPDVITPRVSKPGWYRLYIYGSQEQWPWGTVLGVTNFVIFRDTPGFPKLPPPPPARPCGDKDRDILFRGSHSSQDAPLRGVLGIGPCRLFVENASNWEAEIARLEADVAADEQWYLPYDPFRERKLMIAFSNGTSDLNGVRRIVEHFKDRVKYWEPRNEPNYGASGAQFATNEMQPFYETVKSVSPDLKVMGPGTVSVTQGLQNWLRDFFNAGGGNYIDVFSFHAYNAVEGDLFLARYTFDALKQLLAEYGQQEKEIWQTEQGYFAPVYGSYEPRRQARWLMLQTMLFEQYGIPKEQNYYWYERSHGFWDFPTWLVNDDGSLNPGAVVMRVWSEEVYGTRFSRKFDFGETGNKLYIGNLFEGPGKKVAAFMSAGSTDGKITLLLPGATSVTVVSALGEERNVSVTDGRLVLDVPEIPVYVRLSPAQQIEVEPVDWGPNLARLPGVQVRASGTGVHPVNPSISNSILKLVNGVMETSRWPLPESGRPWMDNTEGFPAWVELTLPSERTIDRVVIYSFPFWQWEGTLLDYELQYEKNGQWVTIERVTEPTKTFKIVSPHVACTVDGFFSERWVFQHSFAPVTTRKIRILVHDCTWGGGATKDVVDAGGQTGPRKVVLREIEVYNSSETLATIAGQVVDPSGHPIPDCRVDIIGTEVDTVCSTDSSGRFSFGRLLLGGNYEISVRKNGWRFSPWRYRIESLAGNCYSFFTAERVTSGSGSGLFGRFYKGGLFDELVADLISPTIDYGHDWGGLLKRIDLAIPFSVLWQGQIESNVSGKCQIEIESTGSERLWLNGRLVFNRPVQHPVSTAQAVVHLEAGELYNVELEFSRTPDMPVTWGSSVRLYWSSQSNPREIIPTRYLYPLLENQREKAVNYAPLALPASITTGHATPVSLTLQGSDPEGQPLSYALVSQPAHGTVTGTPPAITYTPAPGFLGSDSFTFKVNDGQQDSAPAMVSITVQADGRVTNFLPLTVEVRGMAQEPKPGDRLRLTLHYTNEGNQPAANVTLSFPVPEHLEYVSGSADSGGVYDSQQRVLHWTIPAVAAGASGDLGFDVVVK